MRVSIPLGFLCFYCLCLPTSTRASLPRVVLEILKQMLFPVDFSQLSSMVVGHLPQRNVCLFQLGSWVIGFSVRLWAAGLMIPKDIRGVPLRDLGAMF